MRVPLRCIAAATAAAALTGVVAIVAVATILVAPTARAAIVEEVHRVPVAVTDATEQPVRHDVVVTLLRDTARERSPILVLSHGRGPERTTMGRARFPLASRFFVEHGWLVVMPTRIGYGETGGPDVETRNRDCAHAEFERGFATAADETRQVLDWVATRQDVDPTRIVAVGQSYGGAATLALAARNPPGLLAAVNFSGGSGGDLAHHPTRPCNPERVGAAYEGYGRTTRVPELWLYAENDQLWGDAIPKDWFARYRLGGAPATFVETPSVGDDGHLLFNRGGTLWHDEVLRFLEAHGKAIASPSAAAR